MLRFSHGRTCEGDTEVTALSLCVCTVENEGREEYNYSRSVDECDQERRNNIMNLSLLSFSLIGEAVTKRLDAAGLCRICTENGIDRLDLLQEELRFYGRDKLKKAMGESGVSLGSLIASVDFLGAPDKAEDLQSFLTLFSEIERQYYPVNAKYHLTEIEHVLESPYARTIPAEGLTETFRDEVRQMDRAARLVREMLR